MDTSHPACQVALIGEASFCGNLGKAEFSVPDHFDRTLQSQMNDVAIRADTDGSSEHSREMEPTELRRFRKRCNVKRFAKMFSNEFFQLLKAIFVQKPTTSPTFLARHRSLLYRSSDIYVKAGAAEVKLSQGDNARRSGPGGRRPEAAKPAK